MSYWIVSLNLMNPTIVTTPGQYVTRGGEVVTIERLDGLRAYGQYANGSREWWTLSGRTLPFSESPNDLVAPCCLNCQAAAEPDDERCSYCQYIDYQERLGEECSS